MNTMGTITQILQAIGAGDAAINVMGPTLTIAFAWIAGIAVAQLVKFPLAKFVSNDWYGYIVRIVGVMTAFLFAHYLSSHLSVPLEMFTAVCQPIIYALLQAAADRWAPWASAILFRSVDYGKPK
jgi:hypothetical protein